MAVNPAVIGGGVLVAAAAIAGGVYASGAIGGSTTPITYSSTVADKTTDSYAGKFGEDFARHMVSASDNKNEAWWNKVFEQLEKDKTPKVTPTSSGPQAAATTTLSSQFSVVTKGWGNKTEANSLSKVCHEAYEKATTTEIHPETEAEDKTKYERDIWTYCSIANKLPITVDVAKEAGSDSNKIIHAKSKKLISVSKPENKWFWDEPEKAFFKKTTGLGASSTENSEFDKLYKKQDTQYQNKTLKDICKEAYAKGTSDANNQTDAVKFCSLQGKTYTAAGAG